MSMTNEEASNILRLVATEALEGVSRFVESENNRDMFKQAYEMAIKSLEESVAVVRCKDCEYFRPIDQFFGYCLHYVNELVIDINWFCADGERKDGETV